jgi:membrane-bound lytic murein transglycosylase B
MIRLTIHITIFLFFITLMAAATHAAHNDDENGHADEAFAEITSDPTFEGWLQGLRKEASTKGISQQTLDSALAGVKPIARVIELDRNQPEFKLTFEQYLERVVNDRRVRRGRQKLAQNRELLNRIYERYGVQPRFIVALWGIETDFGRITGGFRVIDALVTLAFDGRRSQFFRRQLMDALTILEQGHVTADDMSGSWAGAMGQTQFMPSTFMAHAVDFSGDGRKDVWGTRSDALASGANYLSKTGWNPRITWGREVQLPDGFSENLIGLDVKRPLFEWAKMGVRKVDGRPLPKGTIDASVIKLTGPNERTFLVYSNFHAIMDWNKSENFATAVGILSDRIAGR